MPVGKGSIERAVKAKSKKTEPVKETVIAVTSPEVMEMVTGKRTEKVVRVGDQLPDYLL